MAHDATAPPLADCGIQGDACATTGIAVGKSRKEDAMRKLSLTLAAMLAVVGAMIGGRAQAAVIDSGALQAPAHQLDAVETVGFHWGGHRYCWYWDGWRGPGWYRCGFRWRRGFGWGGGSGWRGWRVPGRRPGVHRPGINRPGVNRPGVNRPGVNRPGVNRPGGNRPGANRPGANRPGGNRPSMNQPGGNRPTTSGAGGNNRPAASGGGGNRPGGGGGGGGGGRGNRGSGQP